MPHFVADHAATMFDELFEGAHGGALRMERLQLVAMGEQQFELECGIGGVIFGPAGREGFAVPRQCQGIDGKEDQKVILAQGEDQGTFVEFEADGHGVAVEPRAQCGDPRVDGLGCVLELQALTFCGARSLEAHIMFGIRPVDTHKGSKCVRCALLSCVISQSVLEWRRRDMRADVLRRHYREPVARQTLSMR